VTIHFLITSAIASSFGIFSHHERYLQTIDTINSIKKYAPNSSITLIDSSSNSIDEYVDILRSQIDELVDYTNNRIVKQIPITWKNESINKNLTETYVIGDFLSQWTCNADRVFKISGRYNLTENFVLEEQDVRELYVFQTQWDSNWPEGMCEIPFQYPSFGFSFPTDHLKFMSEIFNKSHELILEHVNTGRYCDLEHALYNFIPKEKVKLINKEMVKGFTANSGNSI
jgi:hypothetical protein